MNPCYACGEPGKPRDVEGSTYFVCDECWEEHLRRNQEAVEDGRKSA